MSTNPTSEQNTGHGHVYPRPDGIKARCGGPAICATCAADLARKTTYAAAQPLSSNEELDSFEYWWHQKNRVSFHAAYGPDEPYRENWGSGFKQKEREAWMARAALGSRVETPCEWSEIEDGTGIYNTCKKGEEWHVPEGLEPFPFCHWCGKSIVIAEPACAECGAAGGEHRAGCSQSDPADYQSSVKASPTPVSSNLDTLLQADIMKQVAIKDVEIERLTRENEGLRNQMRVLASVADVENAKKLVAHSSQVAIDFVDPTHSCECEHGFRPAKCPNTHCNERTGYAIADRLRDAPSPENGSAEGGK